VCYGGPQTTGTPSRSRHRLQISVARVCAERRRKERIACGVSACANRPQRELERFDVTPTYRRRNAEPRRDSGRPHAEPRGSLGCRAHMALARSSSAGASTPTLAGRPARASLVRSCVPATAGAARAGATIAAAQIRLRFVHDVLLCEVDLEVRAQSTEHALRRLEHRGYSAASIPRAAFRSRRRPQTGCVRHTHARSAVRHITQPKGCDFEPITRPRIARRIACSRVEGEWHYSARG
jgi:hypothetical protein